ncbi:MAG: PhzF family phenazine biosynthesis isomerase [Synechococcales bacterium]|nr:PhzF family phenazine biosynthesis isomerase [Synechococcales bacterium]
MGSNTVHRLAAFTHSPNGGNPAGVWIGSALPEPAIMQRIAAEEGFSETAFLAPETGFDRTIRYYSPQREIPFCGHATIAAGVLLGRSQGQGTYQLSTSVGIVPVTVGDRAGQYHASLTSVEPQQKPVPPELLTAILAAIGWELEDLDPQLSPMLAYAGSWHLILGVKELAQLNALNYEFETLQQLMLNAELITLQLIWQESETIFHSRNPFPIGGVVEDPATGSAAAAFGGYLRDVQQISVPKTILIRQGEAMGRPSQIQVEIPAIGGIVVTGQAVWLGEQ